MVFKCPKGDRIFTRVPRRWCPLCENDYVLTEESAKDLTGQGYIEDNEENQWLFFDLPLKRAALEITVKINPAPDRSTDVDTLTVDDDPSPDRCPQEPLIQPDHYSVLQDECDYTTKDGPFPFWFPTDCD